MIYVSQGHENGIGIEVFLKSFVCLDHIFQEQFVLVVNQNTLKENLSFLELPSEIKNNHCYIADSKISCHWIANKEILQSTDAILTAINLCKPDSDILLTLPTSKDQLVLNGKQFNGHTEMFRNLYKKEEISMVFLAHDSNFLLITDHIAIDEINSKIQNTEYCYKKVMNCLENLPDTRNIKEIYFAGINPHAGENGLISNTDLFIDKLIDKLRIELPNITIFDKLPGDTIQFKLNNKKQLFVFPFHDQGLGIFKSIYGVLGINYSTGMPIKRVSVDHGTAFTLYGKNKANYNGMLYLLNEIKNWGIKKPRIRRVYFYSKFKSYN